MTSPLPAALVTFFALFIVVPIIGGLIRVFGVYAIVQEGTRHVYVLFGNVVGIIEEPGLHLLWLQLGWRALLVNWMGQRHVLDMRMDQEYLRSAPG
ncbi:MAG: SPFH/Band 7/PHB domain protein, partial [Armatimonadetes bacterium]|nr:SPFH/Band 7/PHB domain protein [Armatimonadota bacterium]